MAIETWSARDRTRAAWAGTVEDLRDLASTLDRQVAPLREAELRALSADDLLESTRARRAEDIVKNWTAQARLEWRDGDDPVESTGPLDEVLDRAALLTSPPHAFTLSVPGSSYALPPMVRVALSRSLGSSVRTVRGREPQTGDLVAAVEEQLDRRVLGVRGCSGTGRCSLRRPSCTRSSTWWSGSGWGGQSCLKAPAASSAFSHLRRLGLPRKWGYSCSCAGGGRGCRASSCINAARSRRSSKPNVALPAGAWERYSSRSSLVS